MAQESDKRKKRKKRLLVTAEEIAPPAADRKRKGPGRPKKAKTVVPPIAPPEDDAEATLTARVVASFQRVCELWAAGKSMASIAEELELRNGPALRKVIYKDRALRAVLDEYTQLRADAMYEQAIEWGYSAARWADPKGLKVGIDAAFKAAAQIAPKTYGDIKRMELSGPGGSAIPMHSEVTLTPAEVYERMLRQE